MKAITTVRWVAIVVLWGATALAEGTGGLRRPEGDRFKRLADGVKERRGILDKNDAVSEAGKTGMGRLEPEAEARRVQIEKKQAELEARLAELEKERVQWEARKADMERKSAELEARKSELERLRAEEQKRLEEKRRKMEGKAAAYVDRRQENQEVRIRHGIRKGYLTPQETEALRAQQKAIADLESSLTGDGRLTRTELALLRDALNTASRMIWAEKHDSDGARMPVYRLGKNVFALDTLTAKLTNPDLTRAEGRALLADFHRILLLRDRLANEDLAEEARASLQAEYEALLSAYFRMG